MSFYLHFFDITDHYTGPFDTTDAAEAHLATVRAMGDLTNLRGLVESVPENAHELTPAEDVEVIRVMNL